VLIKAEGHRYQLHSTPTSDRVSTKRELPFVLGLEVCGTIEAVGEDVAALGVGNRVVTAQAGRLLRRVLHGASRFLLHTCLTAWASDVAAASLLKGMTAHYLLKSVYPVQQGDSVLVHAGAGGVGLILTQWATSLAVRVISTVSTPEKAELSRQAGAVEVLDYPDDPEEFGAKIKDLTDGGVAAVYDGVGAATFDASWPASPCAARSPFSAHPADRFRRSIRQRLNSAAQCS
jgi:NADPH2:quinone reductase